MARRRSDKSKLLSGWGQGTGSEYIPWISVQEFGSKGRAHRIFGFKTNRVHSFLSDLEMYYFLIAHWSDKVIDIREQFPLLPLEETIIIANELGIKHPADRNQTGSEFIMTTDFLITLKNGKNYEDIVRTMKPQGSIDDRVKEKFLIEEEFWIQKGINWGIVTGNEFDEWLGRNLEFLYPSYFWPKERGFSGAQIIELEQKFQEQYIKNGEELEKTVETFDRINFWNKGESWKLIEFMILTNVVSANLKGSPFRYPNLRIQFIEKRGDDKNVFEK